MWNDAQALTRLANTAVTLAALLVLYAAASRLANEDIFALREIRVVGAITHVTRDQVEGVVVRQMRGTFFTVNLADVRAAVQRLPWVRHVDVRRHWPDGVEIAIEEHLPLARWGDTGLVNAYGEVFEGASNLKLPLLSGPEGSAAEVVANYRAFERVLAAMGRHVEQIRLSERRAWQLRLDDATLIELGREDPVQRLEVFARAFDRSVALLPGKPAYIDLRYANGFAVRVKGLNRSDERA